MLLHSCKFIKLLVLDLTALRVLFAIDAKCNFCDLQGDLQVRKFRNFLYLVYLREGFHSGINFPKQ